MLPLYDAIAPDTLDEALGALADRRNVVPIAGGTNLVVAMREGAHRGATLLDVSGLHELRGIQLEDGHIVVGAATTVAELLRSPLIAQHAWALHQAAISFANPLVRNRATVAGNLVDASPAADMAPPLLVLDAELELLGKNGSRWVAMDQFIVRANQTVRRSDELVRRIRWPLPTSPRSAGAFHKLALRKGTACSVLSVAVMIMADGEACVTQARIALGALAAKPFRAHAAEEALRGQRLTEGRIAEAAHLAAEATRPIDDVRSTAAYRRRMAGVLTRRMLVEVAAESGIGAPQ
ncbi:FAD binding domain-containing protein [Chloroflexota bacterium]